ncbi:exosome RNA helicase MTR4-like isoform X2 [Gordionus sp. m RMFG-2023]|uniref:exosome RNA helicase MTR4-like isoform X2 n=1 Tax=Gordionus sp. m RMFG-2023 TaxID=3053472 RepID=UPI0031FBB417
MNSMETDTFFDVFHDYESKTKKLMADIKPEELVIKTNDVNMEDEREPQEVLDAIDVDDMPCIMVHTVETSESCLHEVAIPPGTEYFPLKNIANNLAKNKEILENSTKNNMIDGSPSQSIENSEQQEIIPKPAKEYPFILDPFQKEAIMVLENYQSILVSAHTSAGKTAIAEYAIAMSLRDKQRVIYTTPIKALSNQKYRELFEEFKDVGLMTGDITINPTASCLVMTTEILRSMLYRGSEVMREVGWVIFDEIHYMRDKERGVVWEETIILLPDKVHYVFLSATIPNATQFAEWICYLHHQPCHVVYTDYRPTPLQHYVFPANGDCLYLVVDENGDFNEGNFSSAMTALRDTGDNDDRGRKGGSNKNENDVFKLIKMIMERDFQPVIVFSFSRKECEFHALQVSKMDFNTIEEKALVEEVFNNAIDILSDDDKKLPQINHLLPILKKGVGIHHSGLLPIIKETIEILFSEGLIKALFATETFSMGLNMPARTVLFTSCRKYDGTDNRWISSGEYIQMSGRAGRRGIDDKGIIILMIDQRMGSVIGKDIIKGKADPLNSAFHLTYNMVLNLLRVEGINPEYMLEKSFHQFQNYSAIPSLKEKMIALDKELESLDIDNESEISKFYKLRVKLEELNRDLRTIITKPEYILQYLQPGRMVKIKNNDDEFDWGIVVNFYRRAKKTSSKLSSGNTYPSILSSPVGPNNSEDLSMNMSDLSNKFDYIVDVLVNILKQNPNNRCSKDIKPAINTERSNASNTQNNDTNAKTNGTVPKSKKFDTKNSGHDDANEMIVVPSMLPLIYKISSVRLYYPNDLKSYENRQSVLRNIQEIKTRFSNINISSSNTNVGSDNLNVKVKATSDNIPLLDPICDMGIKEPQLKSIVKKIELLEAKIYNHPMFNKPEMEKVYVDYAKKMELSKDRQTAYNDLQKTMSIIKMDELKYRKRVLRRLGFCSENDVIELKGRVACEISTGDELVLTELMFNGAFNNLDCDQIVALLSCFVFQEKAMDIPKLEAELSAPLKMIQETARRIAKISRECKLELDEMDYVYSFKPNLMDVVYAWSKGSPFHEIIKMTDVFEVCKGCEIFEALNFKCTDSVFQLCPFGYFCDMDIIGRYREPEGCCCPIVPGGIPTIITITIPPPTTTSLSSSTTTALTLTAVIIDDPVDCSGVPTIANCNPCPTMVNLASCLPPSTIITCTPVPCEYCYYILTNENLVRTVCTPA